MDTHVKYIELKTGYSGNGPAWIAKVEFSKTGKTIYFNERAFKGNGHGVCSDIETREIYWISGVKRNGLDRHWNGHGKIQIDKAVITEYLDIAGLKELDPKKYIIVDIPKTDKQRFTEIENSPNYETENNNYEELSELTIPELEKVISELKDKENTTSPNNGLKFYIAKRIQAEKLLNHLKDLNSYNRLSFELCLNWIVRSV